MTEAPSIKEALELKPCPFCGTAPAFGRMIEPDQVTIGCNNDGCLVQLCVVSDVESEAVKAWNTRATLQPSGERREAIARMIERLKSRIGSGRTVTVSPGLYEDISEAAVLLASGLVQNEAGIRRDERIFQPIGYTEVGKMIDAGIKAVDLYNIASTDILRRTDIRDFLEAALAIRSARDGGAS